MVLSATLKVSPSIVAVETEDYFATVQFTRLSAKNGAAYVISKKDE